MLRGQPGKSDESLMAKDSVKGLICDYKFFLL